MKTRSTGLYLRTGTEDGGVLRVGGGQAFPLKLKTMSGNKKHTCRVSNGGKTGTEGPDSFGI